MPEHGPGPEAPSGRGRAGSAGGNRRTRFYAELRHILSPLSPRQDLPSPLTSELGLEPGTPAIIRVMPAPYAQYVGTQDPVVVARESLAAFRTLLERLTPADWDRPVGPGKWTIRQVVVHVAQFEMILGNRVRCGVGVDGYVVQTVEQDDLIAEAAAVDGPTALEALVAVRAMNLAFAESLSPAQRRRTLEHPERGTIDVEDILTTLTGHGVHHLQQILAVL